MKNVEILSAEELARKIQDDSVILVNGFTMVGVPEEILRAIEETFLETGHPRSLTIIHAAGMSDRKNGIEHLAHVGLVKRLIGAHWGLAPNMMSLIVNNQLEAFCLPQGQLTHMFRAMAQGKKYLMSKVGLGTFVDPRYEAAKFNEAAKRCTDEIVKLLEYEGEEYLMYALPGKVDYAFIRGTCIDEKGNLSIEEEAMKLEILSMAQAAKNLGGQVVAQVKYVTKTGCLKPKEIAVPGFLIDKAVISSDPENTHRQTASVSYNPAFSGQIRLLGSCDGGLHHLPLPRVIVGKRGAEEVQPGTVLNLGTGIPGDTIGPILAQKGLADKVFLTVESGVIGGIPQGGTDFGISLNPDAIILHSEMFDFYDGGGVDIAFLGAGEVDKLGRVNASRFASQATGAGGFIDISQNARKVVFLMTFTAGGLKIKVENGHLIILNEGRFRKFVECLDHVTFNPIYARAREILYITERAVFKYENGGLVLIEIAPGVNLEKDILDKMAFKPRISPNLRKMDKKFFEV